MGVGVAPAPAVLVMEGGDLESPPRQLYIDVIILGSVRGLSCSRVSLESRAGQKAKRRVDVAIIFIPTMLQPLTGGVKQTECEGRNVRQIIDGLEARYPGIKERLVEDGEIRANLAVAIDGDVARMGMLERVSENSEVHFVPAIGGG